MKLLAKLEKSFDFWYLVIISSVFFLFRFPSLFEPIWYGDEAIYQVLGSAINAGRLLYRDIFDNKPPLLYLLYSLVSSDQFLIRLISLVFGLFSVWFFFFLAQKILENKKAVYIATAFFAVLFGLPLIEGNIANAENFMLFPNIFSAFVLLKALEQKKQNKKFLLLFLSGLIVGVSFLFKIVAVFDFAAFFIILLILNFPQKLQAFFTKKVFFEELKNAVSFSAGFVIPVFLTASYFLSKGAFSSFLTATFFSNIGYVSYGNKFLIPQGLLFIKLFLLFSFLLFVFLKREVLGKSFVMISVWLSFSLFSAFFSQRPYTHYVLVLLPSFCLMLGFFVLNKKLTKLSGVILLSVFILVLLNFGLYFKTAFYYQNFAGFMLGTKSVSAYRDFFDHNTPRDYQLADYILLHTNKGDNIFVWGNNAGIYHLTGKLPPGKYTVAYHILSYKDGGQNTAESLNIKRPKLIIIMPNVPDYPFSLSNYYLKANLAGVDIYERFF